MLIAITGGIGCGKSVVSHLLKVMGYEVYDCDSNAKALMTTDDQLRQGLIEMFGKETYFADGSLNKKHISNSIFNDTSALSAMNALIHPAVARDLISEYKNSKNKIFFFESAILFESNFDKISFPDKVISVTSPLELRIERTMKRDNTTREQVLNRMGNQMTQKEKDSRADFVVYNDNSHSIINQVENILNNILH